MSGSSMLLSAITALPFVGALLILTLPSRLTYWARRTAALFAFGGLFLVLYASIQFNSRSGALQQVEKHAWIQGLNVDYHLGVDGLGILMLQLTALVTIMAIIASHGIEARKRLYFALLLFLQSGLFGVFTAQNFFHWFLFWELSLVPAFFLVRLWGGPLRTPAATQFFIYTMFGSVALLLSFVALYLCTGTFDFAQLAELGRSGTLTGLISERLGWKDLTTKAITLVIFAGVFLGFAVKVPLFPFHTWVPMTYSEAPAGVTMMLTGVMSKMGVYGFIRILLPIFPLQTHWVIKPLLGLAVLSIMLSAAAAWAQKDLKRLFAYSSINHLGYCMLGVFALGTATFPEIAGVEKTAALNGVFLQMFNHGLTAATLFWMVNLMQERRKGFRTIDDFGGIRSSAPVFAGMMGIALFSSLGLPGLNGFVGEFLIVKGSFALAKWATAFSVGGLLLTAVFILTVIQKVFAGGARGEAFADLSWREMAFLGLPVGLMFVFGIYPQALLRFFNATTVEMVRQIGF